MSSPADVRPTAAGSGAAGDAALARREPRLPGLAIVLDADALLDGLDALLPADLARPTAARVDYVRYKPGTSVVAGIVLETPAGPLAAYAKAVRPGSPKLAKARRGAIDAGGGWGVVADPGLGLAIGTAAGDRRLPGAARVTGRGDTHVLRYKPERRLVARGTHGGRPALLKAHQPAAAAAAVAAHRAVASAGAPVADLLSADVRRGVVACAWVTGTPLHALRGDVEAVVRAGAALARLHRAPARGLADPPPLAGELAAAAGAVGALLPSLRSRAAALACRLGRPREARAPRPVPIHGDWSPDQAVRTAGGVVLVDLDRAHRDDPAADIGAWVAAEHVAGCAPAEAPPEEVAAALLAGYADTHGPTLRGRLAEATAAALLRRATEPFRTRHPHWPAEVARLLTSAERHAGSARW